MKKILILSFVVILSLLEIKAQSTTWNIDPVHSSIQFDVTHLVVSTVTGKFTEFSGKIETKDDSFDEGAVDVSLSVASIDTENLTRDKHLKEDDFFNASKYPNISFKSKSFTQLEGNAYNLVGDLTIRDVTKEISLTVTNTGTIDVGGKVISAFKANFKINRFDYKLKWDDTLDSGSLVVGEEVEIRMNLELVKQ